MHLLHKPADNIQWDLSRVTILESFKTLMLALIFALYPEIWFYFGLTILVMGGQVPEASSWLF